MAGEEFANMRAGEFAWHHYEPDARDVLFDELSHGRIKPAQAEERALELGLRPLNPGLDRTRYNPMAETHWTMAMAMAWIAWRDIDRVRDVLPSWRRDHKDWFYREYRVPDGADGSSKRAGWFLEPVHKSESPFMFLSLREDFDASKGNAIDPAMRLTIRIAREQLWQKLGNEAFAATTATEGAVIAQIPAHEWAHLEYGESRERDVLYVRNDTCRVPKYAGDVLIPRQRLLALWPSEAGEPPNMGARDLIRKIADEVVKPGIRASERNKAIREAVKAKGLTPWSDTTIKEALKDTKHIQPRKRRLAP